jgi:hypothetical protein
MRKPISFSREFLNAFRDGQRAGKRPNLARLRRLASQPGRKLGYDAQITPDPANSEESWSPECRTNAKETPPGLDQENLTLQRIMQQLPIHNDHRRALLDYHYSDIGPEQQRWDGPSQMQRFSRDLAGGSNYQSTQYGERHPDEESDPSDNQHSAIHDKLGRAKDQLEQQQVDLLQQPQTVDQLGEHEQDGMTAEHLKLLLQICLKMCGGDEQAASFMAGDYLKGARDEPPPFKGMPYVGEGPRQDAAGVGAAPQVKGPPATDARPQFPRPQGFEAKDYGGSTQYEREQAYIADRIAQAVAQRHGRIAVAVDRLPRNLPRSVDRYALATASINAEDQRQLAMDAKRHINELGKQIEVLDLGYSPPTEHPPPQMALDHRPGMHEARVNPRAVQDSIKWNSDADGFAKRNPHAAKIEWI